jgi:hypothetical protein
MILRDFNSDLILSKNAASEFLINLKSDDGMWRDFNTLAGYSDEWLTGFTADSLALFGGEAGATAAKNAFQQLLGTQANRSGWGYNQYIPRDADSTIWVLRLSQSLGYTYSAYELRNAYRFLKRHIHRDGGVSTYKYSPKMKVFLKLQGKKVSFKGWCMPHVCVSAAFAGLDHPSKNAVLEFLRNHQQGDGSWKSYWYTDPEYATAMVVEALARTGNPDDLAICFRSAQWVESRVKQNVSNPFVAALSLRILLAVQNRFTESLNKLVAYLLSTQQPDGGWISSAYMRIPHTDEIDPDSFKYWLFEIGDVGSIQKDNRRIFTTATVLASIGTAIKKAKLLAQP